MVDSTTYNSSQLSNRAAHDVSEVEGSDTPPLG
jgi:hypothetical protein